ncbi:MAG: bifunctional nicotinamidase/pyrazinamidase [Myxococcota bacterium]|nr:bifunctional nicotinamidase/pyrazinamidase [Myxococcota bacterium]
MAKEIENSALLVIDVQNDFLPGGALAVPEGDQVVPIVEALLPRFSIAVATQDWHPPEHGSFAANHSDRQPGEVIELNGLTQILWPTHCVSGSEGAEFAAPLSTSNFTKVFRKGSDPQVDSYSGFFDNGRRHETGLHTWLRSEGVDHLYILGLATDYCVAWSALDAVELGFAVTLVEDGCRGVELNSGDIERAKKELREAGVRFCESDTLTS